MTISDKQLWTAANQAIEYYGEDAELHASSHVISSTLTNGMLSVSRCMPGSQAAAMAAADRAIDQRNLVQSRIELVTQGYSERRDELKSDLSQFRRTPERLREDFNRRAETQTQKRKAKRCKEPEITRER